MAKKSEKQLAQEWKQYTDNIRHATPVDLKEKPQAKKDRIARLEADREAWFKYYFNRFSFADPAPFHIDSSDRIIAAYDKMTAKGFGKFYQSRRWARGCSKSTRRMMEVMYLMLAKKMRINAMLISKSHENAKKLLKPYRGQLEANQRIIQDYGVQQRLGSWEEGEFTTQAGNSFLAVGRGQSPRGTKDDEMRVNVIIFDDADDDELCRNRDLLDEAWNWVEQAVMPCVEISRPYFIFFDNNIIGEDSLAVRASHMANDGETVNIRDERGRSTWPQKNTEEIIDLMLDGLSYESQQKEYYNNPMSSGKTFAEIKWGPCPPLSEMSFIMTYADPAPSNRDMPGAKNTHGNSRKAIFTIAAKGNDYYIYYGFLDVMGNDRFMQGMYECREYIRKQTLGRPCPPCYYYIENNTLQDPFYQQVLLPLMYKYGSNYGGPLPIVGDTRKKPDKWPRIEALLEPVNRLGHLIFNQAEEKNPHMKRLESQFKAAKPTSRELDGPDCIEGGIYLINQKQVSFSQNAVMFRPRQRSSDKHY